MTRAADAHDPMAGPSAAVWPAVVVDLAFAPPGRACLLVDASGRIHRTHGDVARYLAAPEATPADPDAVFAEPVRSLLRRTLEQAVRTAAPAAACGPWPAASGVPEDDGLVSVRVAPAAPGSLPEEAAAFVVVIESDAAPTEAGMRVLAHELAESLRECRRLREQLEEAGPAAAGGGPRPPGGEALEHVLHAAGVGLVVLDRTRRVRWRTAETPPLSVGDDREVTLPPDAEAFGPAIEAAVAGGTVSERLVRLADGRAFRLSVHPTRGLGGDAGSVVLASVDVTDLTRAETQLRRLNRQLEARNAEAEAFAHTVSHDLKSPLVTIGCMMGLLRETLGPRLDADAAGFVDQAEATVGSMRQTIDDLLELSRVGRTPNRITRVALGPLVEEVLRTHAVALGRGGVRVRVHEPLPEIEADRRRLTQVVDNLVANAIAYGCGPELADPRIEIDAELRGEECVLSVRDHGPGVPEAFAEQVFGLFQRLRQDRPGTGVGLALVRRIADAHGGRVWVEAADGGGARFRVSLPRTAATAATVAAGAES